MHSVKQFLYLPPAFTFLPLGVACISYDSETDTQLILLITCIVLAISYIYQQTHTIGFQNCT